jgi:hypothetical protein
MTDTLYLSVAQARETMPCPLARTFADKKGPNCMGDAFHAEAVKRVMRNPEGYRIKRELGYCGLGGPVT